MSFIECKKEIPESIIIKILNTIVLIEIQRAVGDEHYMKPEILTLTRDDTDNTKVKVLRINSEYNPIITEKDKIELSIAMRACNSVIHSIRNKGNNEHEASKFTKMDLKVIDYFYKRYKVWEKKRQYMETSLF